MGDGERTYGSITLPAPPKPAAAYLPVRRSGRLLFVAGQLPFVDGALPVVGKLGAELDTEEGIRQARQAGLNSLSVAVEANDGADQGAHRGLSGLRAVQLTIYVASTPDYYEHHLVANGASNALTEALGNLGEHSRTTIATPCLALNSPVEVQAIFEISNSDSE
jgi:enamine deaminase RidA (YjgF/YER057c/UK114 family)